MNSRELFFLGKLFSGEAGSAAKVAICKTGYRAEFPEMLKPLDAHGRNRDTILWIPPCEFESSYRKE
jgi:hypothetical protein